MICLLLLFCSFSFMADTVEMTVIWVRSTDPVTIGEELRLFCNTSRSWCPSCTSRWFMGLDLLSFNNDVTDRNKYAVQQVKDGFTLVIKNLIIADFNTEYKCQYGFSAYKKKLTLPASFLVYPRNDTVERNILITNRTLLLNVVFKEIHPVPVCNIYLDRENLSAKIEVMRKEYLYQVRVTVKHTARPDQCEGRLLVDYTVGTKKFIVVNDIVKFECNGIKDIKQFTLPVYQFVIVILGPLCVVIIVAVTVIMHRKGKCKDICNNTPDGSTVEHNANESANRLIGNKYFYLNIFEFKSLKTSCNSDTN